MLKPPTEKISAETREKLLALAEFIENDPTYGFKMSVVRVDADRSPASRALTSTSDRPECGTAGCLLGHWQFMGYKEDDLGLTQDQSNALFFPKYVEMRDGRGLSPIISNDRRWAVRVLRNFAYTGDVDWSV